MFPSAAPSDSILCAHKQFFYTCGQICLVSIVQGGPPASLFEECVYDLLINQDLDMNQLPSDQHLTKSDKDLMTNKKSQSMFVKLEIFISQLSLLALTCF